MSRPPSPSDEVRAQLADRKSRAYATILSLPNDWLLFLLTLLVEEDLRVIERALEDVAEMRAAGDNPALAHS